MTGGLVVEGLSVSYGRGDDRTTVVSDVSFALRPGAVLGLAGESGCGKSTTALASMGFQAPGSNRDSGSIRVGNLEVATMDRSERRELWGRRIAYVAQEASAALSPLVTIGDLLDEALVAHLDLSRDERAERSGELLERVGIPDVQNALKRYPHQFSGGQQQRIALAIALACEPDCLLLDEPTTGLDVTTQARVAELIRELVRDRSLAALFVSHDLGLLRDVCDEIAIMYAGEVVEFAPAAALFDAGRHPYARALLDSAPRVDEATLPVGIRGAPPLGVVEDRCPFADRCRFAADECVASHPDLIEVAPGHSVRCVRTEELGVIAPEQRARPESSREVQTTSILEIRELVCRHGSAPRAAVAGVSIAVARGEVLGIVGESGSGKTTLLRSIAGLHPAEAGEIRFSDAALAGRAVKRSAAQRQAIQLVFQNPDASLNPRHFASTEISRPLKLFFPKLSRDERARRLDALAVDVRLDRSLLERYPHQLSGGQKQRVALARALAAEPELLLCDEVVSALDVSVQASILELLSELVRGRSTTMVFVTHDLAVVRSIADRIAVMKDGEIREVGTPRELFEAPKDEYTRELLAAVPGRGGA